MPKINDKFIRATFKAGGELTVPKTYPMSVQAQVWININERFHLYLHSCEIVANAVMHEQAAVVQLTKLKQQYHALLMADLNMAKYLFNFKVNRVINAFKQWDVDHGKNNALDTQNQQAYYQWLDDIVDAIDFAIF